MAILDGRLFRSLLQWGDDMKYIKLTRGNTEIWYPMFEIKPEYIGNGFGWTPFTTEGGSVSGAISAGNIPGTIQEQMTNIFYDEIPLAASEFGSLIQTEDLFIQDPDRGGNWLKRAGGDYTEIPVGEKPDDWDTNYFDYCTITQDNYWQMWIYSVPIGGSQIDVPPTWNATAQYYKNNTSDLRERFNHMFKTSAGFTFGIWTGTGAGFAGYNKHYSRLGTNPGGLLFDTANKFYLRDPNGTILTFTGLNRDQITWYSALTIMDLTPYGESGYSTIPLQDNSRTYYIFVYVTYQSTTYYGIMNLGLSSGGAPVNARMLLFDENLWGADSISDDPPEPAPQEGEWGDPIERAGGHGSFSDPSDDSGAFDGTALAADIAAHAAIMNANIQAGGFHVYRLAAGAMAAISRVLFSQSFFGLFTVSRYNPLSCILSYHQLPATLAPLTLDGSAQTAAVKAGGYNFNTDPDTPAQVPFQSLVDSESHYFVGAADIPLYYDAFPDFAPFTSAKIHLPYIGEMALDINKFQGGRIAVDYNCDVISGNVCAVITCQDRNGRHREVYTATGNAAYTLPVFSESQSGAAVGKLIGSGVTAAVTGNAAGVLGAAAGAAEMAAVGVPHSPQIQGSFGGNVGAIGNRICFLEITRPVWVETKRFQELAGIPSGLSGTIANLRASGFIQVQTIETEGIQATQAECDLIEQILKSGIYVK